MKAHAVLVRDLVLWVFVVSVASLAGFRLLADPPNGIARVGTPKADAKCGAGLAKEEAVEHRKSASWAFGNWCRAKLRAKRCRRKS